MRLDLQHDASELAMKRHSVRTYLPRMVEERELAICMAPLTDETGIFGAKTRYAAVQVDQTPSKLGTYGMIRDAKTFLAAVVSKKELRAGYLQVGYQLEQTVLIAADNGMGTCWLGGTFDKTAFFQAAGVDEEEQLVIVLPIGYPSGKTRLLEHIVRGTAGSANRRPFEKLFFQAANGEPLSEKMADAFALPLSCVRLAPSAINKQPWRVFVSPTAAYFYLDGGKEKPTIPDIRYVDLGIAMCHFEAGTIQAGLQGGWVFEDPELSVPMAYEFIGAWKVNKN
ncbi:MAG: nitroreductase family protein [Ethanoligenens sp.]